jgi:hypothetical protein
MTYIPGGGGGGSIATSSDVALNNPANGEVLTFDTTLNLWRNAAGRLVPVNVQSISYRLTLADVGKAVEITSATASTITIPLNSSVAFPIGTNIDIYQHGTGQITVGTDAGVTLRSHGSVFTLAGQYSSATLRKRGTNEWVLSGNIAAPDLTPGGNPSGSTITAPVWAAEFAPDGLAEASHPNGSSTGLVIIDWDPLQENVSAYEAQWSANGTTGWTSFTDIPVPSVDSSSPSMYSDSSIPLATNRYYRVRGKNGATLGDWSTVLGPVNVADTGGGGTPISAPVWTTSHTPDGIASSTSNGSGGTVVLDWDPLADTIDAYELQWSVNGSTSWTSFADIAVPLPGGGSSSTYTDTSLPYDTNRYYRVRGKNGATLGVWSVVIGPVLVEQGNQGGGGALTYAERWGNANDSINAPIPNNPTIYASSTSVVSGLRTTNISSTSKPTLTIRGEVPPIYLAPSAPGVDADGNDWQWYTLHSDYLGTADGTAMVLCHSNMRPGGGMDNPLLIMCPTHNPPSGPQWGSNVYVRTWETGGGPSVNPATAIDHANKKIVATGITPIYYGDRGTGATNVWVQSGNLANGWGRAWNGVVRGGDIKRGVIEHSMLAVIHDGWLPNAEGSGASAAFWSPAVKTDQGSGPEGNGGLIQGMVIQLVPSKWTDARIRQQMVYTSISYSYSHSMVNGGSSTATTSNTLYDRGPGSTNTIPWPVDGGPKVTHREFLHMLMVSARDYGFIPHDGGGTSVGFRVEHADSAKWVEQIVQGGENPADFGFGNILRGKRVHTISTNPDFYGFPWEDDDLRVLNGSKTTAPK